MLRATGCNNSLATVVAKGDGLETGFQDGRQFLRPLKRKRINNQPLATILNLPLPPHLTLTSTLTLTVHECNPKNPVANDY